MARVSWSDVGQRFYEAGTDRGVLYLDGQDGVPWNGLIGINESPSGGEPRPYYLDGFKYLNIAAAEEFSATIRGYSSPREFDACDGTTPIHYGLFATQQPRKQFGLSYRTLVGNDVDALSLGYKIHIVYNALASPASRSYQSLGSSVSPVAFDWKITTVPPDLPGIRPTAHFVIDSRITPPRLLEKIEDILYGTASSEPRLPSAEELAEIFRGLPPIASTNWMTHGSFEIAGANVQVRRNLNANPRMINSAAYWAVASTASMTAGPTGNLITITTAAASLTAEFYHNAHQATSAGLVYSASMEVTIPTDGVAITFDLRNFAYGTDTVLSSSGLVTVQPGETVTLVSNSNGATTAAGTTGVRSILYVNGGTPVGAKFIVRNALLEQAVRVGSYFDGITPPKYRRNAATQPQARSATGWSSNDGTLYSRSWDSAGGRRAGAGAMLFTRTAANPNSVLASVYAVGVADWNAHAANWTPVVPGEEWTISAYAKSDVPFNTRMIVAFRDINGAAVGSSQIGALTVDTPANEWAQASHTVVVPAGAVYMAALQNVGKSSGNIVGGEKTWMTDALYEKVSSIREFFDSTTIPASGFGVASEGTVGLSPAYMYDTDMWVAWTGASDASISDLLGVGAAGYSSPSNVVRAIQSTRWAKEGSKSLRQIPAYPTRSSGFTEIANYLSPKDLIPGGTYTFVGTFYQEAPQGFSTVSEVYRAITLTGTGQVGYNKFAQAADVAGEQELRLTFTIPPTGPWYLRMYNGGMLGDPSVWWDFAAIVDGVYEGPAFNGNTPDTDIRVYDWLGLPNESPSVIASWYY